MTTTQISFTVPKSKIAENGDYNLTGDRYRETVDYSNAKWPMVELGELEKQEKVQFLRGQGISKKEIVENGKNKCIHYGEIYTEYQPIIKNIVSRTNYEGKILSKKGDVLVPSTTTADAMGIAVARSLNENDVILGGDINIIRTENKYVLSDYLALLISTPPLKNQLATYAKGVNILHISNSDIRNLKIPLPPLSVQEQIVAEIEQYQKVIDGAKQVVANWKPNIKFPSGGVDSEAGRGGSWHMVELGEVCEKITDGSHFSPETITNGYPYITVKDLTDNGIDLRNSKRISKEDYEKLVKNGCKPVKDDILFSKDGTVGKVAFVDFSDDFVVLSSLAILTPNITKAFPKYISLILQSPEITLNALGMMKGIAIRRVILRDLKTLKIPLPPLEVQEQIVAEIEAEQRAIDECKTLIEKMQKKIEAKINEIW